MKRAASKIMCVILSCIMVFGVTNAAMAGDLNNFKQERIYSGAFSDVESSDWFYSLVSTAYEYGITDGYSESEFAPYEPVSQSQAIAFGAKINAVYNGKEIETPAEGENWYEPYIKYAIDNAIIEDGVFEEKNYSKPATRAQVAYILARSVDFSDLKNINTSISSLPDVSAYDKFYNEIIMLYRAGVLAGKDDTGRFYPDEYITRSEVCAIISRIIDKNERMSLTLKDDTAQTPQGQKYDAVGIAKKASSAVFYIEIYDSRGAAEKSGSGFFISSDGIAVTNYHVIEDGYSAKIKLNDSTVYDVSSVLGYDKERDIAILKIDGSGFNYLETADSDQIVAGESVFCIGSPLGLDNTISTGVISNTNRIDSNLSYIQITAPISSGSSGGAVLDEYCKVIGISCGGYTEGQNLNLAIPINALQSVPRDKNVTLYELTTGGKQPQQSTGQVTIGESEGYSDNKNILDFGKLNNITESASPTYTSQIVRRSYQSNIDAVNNYIENLYKLGFYRQRITQINGNIAMIFVSRSDAMALEYNIYSGATYVSYYFNK